MLAKLQEFVVVWTCAYGKAEEKQLDPFFTELQNKLIIMSEQLLVLLARSLATTSKEIKEAMGSIIANLLGLGYKKFYIDGGASLNEFNELGDSTLQDSDSLVKQVLHEKEQLADTKIEEQFD